MTILTIAVCGAVIYSYKIHKSSSEVIKNSETKKPPSEPVAPPTKPPISKSPPASFPLNNIPAKRGDIQWKLTLEQGKANKMLLPKEENTIIECLSSQVKIDKSQTFNFRKCFSMVPGVREIQGDTDEALTLSTDQGKFFIRINNFSDLSRFEYEKESMLAINEVVSDMAPRLLVLGNLPEGGKFLVVNFIKSNWDDRLKIENVKALARSLVQLHKKKSQTGKFGFQIGKNNQQKDNWATFFYENRWQPLWKRVLEKYPQDKELKKWGTIIGEKVIPELLGNLPVEPVLIHGNLDFDSWDINSQTNQPWLFDAHCYYGHNEMDLSLIHYSAQELDWIGGKVPEGCEGEFSYPEFTEEYQKYNSLLPGFEERKTLYRLYYYLFRKFLLSHFETKWKEKILTMMQKLGQKYN
ncbi:MAG: fructosamine kinase family protein [Candidatus Moeniiplasma glomeromycotorum]|nr:fructosamine kinase family protein [Candidatus Moeniiplasma glomeromycotorum]MCE8162200.1 fructosamine kinase family protein [Candidatus Moeniiplasma glomeromycotorum]MCE8166144.1 fructosamine kinase family protein [Candidatus Moeniiplasma glomeromycotorum]MCE8166599.1 fructosamine kinase family protein [Candidatus Moeniiplasma glomeromycotorum]